ncbi:hypothetical protein [Paracoccus spongiarum]|uniref:O-antigen ligase domain-containing protein n=1 Tax=Paracoccus spongiarum TaxID=3064387 RepID=A0ABT9J865_9RHOB|nr:hypothetical protein [Paracoccus sp. 2205BS29-5]MDP5305999.1 hypothetical protein [Paracoccus sp. 2205BS29-5]
MPNSLAVLMMTSWPFVTLAMYLRLPPRSAVIWSILAGYMLLPAGMSLDLPALPGLSKHSIPSLFGYFFAWMVLGRRIPLFPASRIGRVFAVVLLAGPFLTVLTNGDPIYINSDKVLPALRLYDAASMVVGQLGFLCIWALSREILNDAAALRQLLMALVVAFLCYTLPMLYEVRMSPQLHIRIYGFFQHDFAQMMRQGGFRPIVFLEHGLWIAILTSMSAMLAVVLARTAPPETAGRWRLAAVYLLAVLVLCKSMAALIYAALMIPLLALAGARRILNAAMLMAVLILSYPTLRTLDVIPTDRLIEAAARVSEERAQSLEFRFDNEDALLAHAMRRPAFGWGGWERSSIHDPASGETVSTTDGLWVIAMGYSGFFGFLAQFGLLVLPILLLGRAYRAAGRPVEILPAGAALVLAVNLVDLLPNATISPFTWMFSGAMLGYVESLRRLPEGQAEAEPRPAAPRRGAPAWSGLVGQLPQGPRSLL